MEVGSADPLRPEALPGNPKTRSKKALTMDALVIEGGHKLAGRVRISGAKNAALPVMAATLLAPGVHKLRNVPRLADTKTMAKLWGVPAFVIGQNMAKVVQSEEEVEEFYGGAKDMYNERGIIDTRAEIEDLDWIDQDLVVATVRWPSVRTIRWRRMVASGESSSSE